MDDRGQHLSPSGFSVLVEIETYIVTDGLRKTGCGNTYRLGVILAYQVVKGLLQVVAAPKDSALFAEVGRCDVDGFFEMADDIATDVCGAAL